MSRECSRGSMNTATIGASDAPSSARTLPQARKRPLASMVFDSIKQIGRKLAGDLDEERRRRVRAEASENAMRQALAFETAAAQEAHHRAKNTLQIAASVLSLHSRAATSAEARTALQESYQRLQLLAKVHDLLSRNIGGTREIPIHRLLRAVGAALRQSFRNVAPRVRLRIRIDRIRLNRDDAIPLGLLANEVLTNAYKYAFPEPLCGEIALTFKHGSDGGVILRIADNGVGLRDGSSERRPGFEAHPHLCGTTAGHSQHQPT